VSAAVFVTSTVGVPVPAARYTSYDTALTDEGHVSVAVFCVASVVPAAGDVLVTHAGTVTVAAVVNVVALLVAQVVAAPTAFLGAIYHVYVVPAVKPVAL
jgi:hypothetical protein